MRETRPTHRGSLLSSDPGPVEHELIERHCAEWLAVGLSTEPSDRGRAEAALREAYTLAEIPRPAFEWLGSPAALFRRLYEDRQVREPDFLLYGPVWQCLSRAERVPTPVWPLWTFAMSRRLTRSIEEGFYRPVWIAASAHGIYFPPVGILGQIEAPWLASARFFEEMGFAPGGRPSRRLALREEVARSCGWVWAREDRCLIADRPVELYTETVDDEVTRIHRTDGPAVVFRDGFEVWAWRGVALERREVEDPSSFTAEKVRTEHDPRRRRALLDRMGVLRYLEESGAEVVEEIPAHAPNVPAGLRGARLLRAPWYQFGEEPLVALTLVDRVPGPDGAPRWHAIRVPPTVESLREAAAWTFGLETEEYAPEVET